VGRKIDCTESSRSYQGKKFRNLSLVDPDNPWVKIWQDTWMNPGREGESWRNVKVRPGEMASRSAPDTFSCRSPANFLGALQFT